MAETRGSTNEWAFDCALAIVNGAYSLHGRPIIGDSNEIEAKQLAEMILRFHQACVECHAATGRQYVLDLIDVLTRPIQDGGEGMADNQDSPLMRLRGKIVLDNNLALG